MAKVTFPGMHATKVFKEVDGKGTIYLDDNGWFWASVQGEWIHNRSVMALMRKMPRLIRGRACAAMFVPGVPRCERPFRVTHTLYDPDAGRWQGQYMSRDEDGTERRYSSGGYHFDQAAFDALVEIRDKVDTLAVEWTRIVDTLKMVEPSDVSEPYPSMVIVAEAE